MKQPSLIFLFAHLHIRKLGGSDEMSQIRQAGIQGLMENVTPAGIPSQRLVSKGVTEADSRRAAVLASPDWCSGMGTWLVA